ncbi:MAG: dihydrofolate synthase / folylpolyglutamate synthase [Gaiellaceae bacterium]|nr:dihydrofolate synthase / folylpolyglutamate synthase [Gaiellaceae bacterium]
MTPRAPIASATAWVAALSPWPTDGFGLDRMRELLAELGDPQLSFPAIHVVGTNGKSTTTRAIAATLRREGLRVGAYTSPHVAGWPERIGVDGADADFERAVERVRPAAERLGATQFEILTAAALAEFAGREVDAAVVEAGLGGRLDATNVLESRVVVLTNVGLEHTDVLGETREAIAREKLAVVKAGATVVLGEPEWEELARTHGAAAVLVEPGGNEAIAGVAASAFLGRSVEPASAKLAGRLDRRGDELWDGAHTPEAVRWLDPHLPPLGAIVASVLADKDVEGILEALGRRAPVLVATRSSNSRALSAEELALRGEPYFQHVESVPDPAAARRRAHELAGPAGVVLVTGSLYLLADLSADG